MKTAVIRFLGIDFIAVPQLREGEGERACEGCAFALEASFDCGQVNPTCAADKSIYVLNEQTLINRITRKLLNEKE